MVSRIFFFFMLISLTFISCKNKTQAPASTPVETSHSFEDVPSEIKKNIHAVFDENKRLGQIYKIVTVSNWEGGPRYTVLTNGGMFMAYIDQNNKVAQLWQKNLAGDYIQIF